MSAAALASINTLLQIKMGSPLAYQTVANVGDYNPISPSANVVDVTSHSTGTPWRQKIITLLDAGKLTAKIFYVPTEATHDDATGLLGLLTTRALTDFQIVFPDSPATKFQFSGYVSTFTITSSVAGVEEASLTVEITGEPDFDA
jgi:predicted secreted protein